MRLLNILKRIQYKRRNHGTAPVGPCVYGEWCVCVCVCVERECECVCVCVCVHTCVYSEQLSGACQRQWSLTQAWCVCMMDLRRAACRELLGTLRMDIR